VKLDGLIIKGNKHLKVSMNLAVSMGTLTVSMGTLTVSLETNVQTCTSPSDTKFVSTATIALVGFRSGIRVLSGLYDDY
jgi:hypothetical protein